MKIFSNLFRRTVSTTKRFLRTTHPGQMREWSRTNLYTALGLLLLAMILLAVASPGPLSVELPEHMASTNAAFIELVLVAAGGFFVSGFMFFLVAWQAQHKSLLRASGRTFRFGSAHQGLAANTRVGKSDMESLLAKLRSKGEL